MTLKIERASPNARPDHRDYGGRGQVMDMRRAVALLALVTGLAACGGTITFGSSSPSPPVVAFRPTKPPDTPPAGTTPGTLMALDATTGDLLWQSQAPMAATNQLQVSGGTVLVQGGYGGPPGVVAAINAKTGDLIWRATPAVCGPTAVGLEVLLIISCAQAGSPPFGQMVALALDVKTGRELWSGPGIAAAAGPGIAIVIVQTPSGDFKIHGLDALTGHQLWEAGLTVTNIPPFVNGRFALAVQSGCPTFSPTPDIKPSSCTGPGQARSFLSRLDLASGSLLWQVGFGQGGQLRRLVLGDVAVVTIDVETPPGPGKAPQEGPGPERLAALDLNTGNELWRQTVTPYVDTPILAVPGTVFISHLVVGGAQQCSTRIDALDSKSGIFRWRLGNLDYCQVNADADGTTTVLVLSSVGATKIVALDTASGTKRWEKPIATPGPYPLVWASVTAGVVYVAASGRFIAPPPGD